MYSRIANISHLRFFFVINNLSPTARSAVVVQHEHSVDSTGEKTRQMERVQRRCFGLHKSVPESRGLLYEQTSRLTTRHNEQEPQSVYTCLRSVLGYRLHAVHQSFDMENIEEFFEVALRLVREAGDIIEDRINRPKDVMIKSCDVDLVTESDRQVEKLFMSGIAASFPDHRFIGEETTSSEAKVQLTDAPTWVIDPIDGTMNFVHGLPHTCISVALLIDKVSVIGIVYNPIINQLFTAIKGKGAFLNDAPIKVSGEKELSKALLMVEMGTSRDPAKMKIVFENLQILTPKVHGSRALGSAALNMCMVALGGADANFEFGIHIWDYAAGDLIVREAGGVCIDPAGGPLDLLSRRMLCASSMELAQEISGLLAQYYPTRD